MSKEAMIHDRIVDSLTPSALEVINESHMHSGNAKETHFKVVVVSEAFAGKKLIDRHRVVNALFADSIGKPGGIHALSIFAYTPEQWAARGGEVPPSPPCRGGSKAEKQ